jgi:4-hydroxybenzoate polyprenyltransferase
VTDSTAPTSRLHTYLNLIRFNRPIGTLLLLWPTLTALWIASEGIPSTDLLLIFIVGTFLTRSAGCVVNDLADRHVDGDVSRTRARPLVTGQVSAGEAMALAAALGFLAFVLVLFTNNLTIFLSFVAVALASSYPFMKRITHLPQVVLGAAFSWGIPMSFAAVRNELPVELWLIFTANLLWTVAYDTEYAMVDREDDRKIGVKSTAILFGDMDKMMIGALQVFTLMALVLTGQRFELGGIYFLSLGVAAALFAYQQYLIRERQPDACFKAFLHNNYVGLAVFLGVVLHYGMAGVSLN